MLAQHLVGLLLPSERVAFLTALRAVAEAAFPEDAAYLALRKIGKTERQARWMISVARMPESQASWDMRSRARVPDTP